IELLIVLGVTADRRKSLMKTLVPATALMIGLGYPGEVSAVENTKWIFWVLAMIPFVYILATVAAELKKATARESAGVAKGLRLAMILLLVAWLVYPISYLFPIIFGESSAMAETVRQVGYSLADLLAKPVYGLAILAVAKLRTAEEAPSLNS
ncbi:MAG: hypothetical protein RLY23_1960, partial [Actinomycetota bacterium]